jgi:ATP-dependent exoDNAse (exonuclease V) beta subunit
MAHYYTLNGEPQHTQLTAAGAKNETRPTTSADARKKGLIPSVTEYLKLLHNHGLERYKLRQVALVAGQNPPIGDENKNIDEWIDHTIKASEKDAGTAADLGTAIHDALEAHFGDRAYDPTYAPYVQPTALLMASMGLKTGGAEMILVNPEYGYAGTTDLVFRCDNGEHGIIDFKSQRFKKNPNVYDTHVVQLAAYHMAFYGSIEESAVAYNIYLSTTNPGLVKERKYNADELRNGWEEFLLLLALYRLKKKYDPRKL